jgi:hypothetical protein
MYFTGFHRFGEYLNRYEEVEKKEKYLEWERTTKDNPQGEVTRQHDGSLMMVTKMTWRKVTVFHTHCICKKG